MKNRKCKMKKEKIKYSWNESMVNIFNISPGFNDRKILIKKWILD